VARQVARRYLPPAQRHCTQWGTRSGHAAGACCEGRSGRMGMASRGRPRARPRNPRSCGRTGSGLDRQRCGVPVISATVLITHEPSSALAQAEKPLRFSARRSSTWRDNRNRSGESAWVEPALHSRQSRLRLERLQSGRKQTSGRVCSTSALPLNSGYCRGQQLRPLCADFVAEVR